MKLSLGAGMLREQGDGWIHQDLLPLPGIDVVHNLVFLPYPFEDESFEFVKCADVLEHLPNYSPDWKPMVTAFIEEMHRILKPSGVLWIRTPRYDAAFLPIDPSHVRGFHEQSMDFYSKTTDFGRSTGFYSNVDFAVSCNILPNKNLEFTMIKR